jgi:hypothetical protein
MPIISQQCCKTQSEICGQVGRTFGPGSRVQVPVVPDTLSHQCSSTGLSKAEWCVDCLRFMHIKDHLGSVVKWVGPFFDSTILAWFSGVKPTRISHSKQLLQQQLFTSNTKTKKDNFVPSFQFRKMKPWINVHIIPHLVHSIAVLITVA